MQKKKMLKSVFLCHLARPLIFLLWLPFSHLGIPWTPCFLPCLLFPPQYFFLAFGYLSFDQKGGKKLRKYLFISNLDRKFGKGLKSGTQAPFSILMCQRREGGVLWGVSVLCKESSHWQHRSLDLEAAATPSKTGGKRRQVPNCRFLRLICCVREDNSTLCHPKFITIKRPK